MFFVVAVTASVVVQMGVFVGMYLSIRRLQQKLESLIERDIQPLLAESRILVADGRKTIVTLQATTEEVSQFAHTQTGRLDELFAEAVERARLQLLRADDIFTDALSRLEVTAEEVHKTVSTPLREIQAILAGVRTAFEFLGGGARKRPRGPVDRSTQDEEMFI